MNLKNKKVLITGATGGIGNCLVDKFNSFDCQIVATGTNQLKLQELKDNKKAEKYFAAKDELGGLGEKEIYDTIRFYTMSIRDYLDEYFESDITKAHLAGSAIIGNNVYQKQ